MRPKAKWWIRKTKRKVSNSKDCNLDIRAGQFSAGPKFNAIAFPVKINSCLTQFLGQ